MPFCRTVQEKHYGHIAAKPKLLVNDHQKGGIETRKTIYAEGVSGKCHPYEAGIALDVTPHVLEGGSTAQLDVVVVRSDFLERTSAKPLETQFSRVECSVVLPDGYTVILGGMIKRNKAGAKVPVLGDLPLFGGLFRSDHDEQAESYLYLLVKAEIIPADEPVGVDGLKVLSERQQRRVRKTRAGVPGLPGFARREAQVDRPSSGPEGALMRKAGA